MSLLIHLTPLLLLILLYRLCPAHFPPSTTTSKLFLLYTLSSHLLAHGTSPWSLIQNLALIVLAHILIAAIYLLHYLAKLACYAKQALLPVYAHVAKSIQLSVQNLAAHVAQLEDPSQDKVLDKDHLAELDINSEPELPQHTDALHEPVDDTTTYVPPPEEIAQLRQDWKSSVLAFLHEALFRLYDFAQLLGLYILHFYSLFLSHLDIATSLYNHTALALYITRIRLTLVIRHNIEPFCQMSSYLVVLGNLYAPAIAIFALHLIFWTILLSIGELYALSACILSIFWMLSWLS